MTDPGTLPPRIDRMNFPRAHMGDQTVSSELLTASRIGDGSQAERLFVTVYDELRQIAAAFLRREAAGHTLQPTALVHEAYLKLVDQTRASWTDQNHFLAVASEAIRRILVDHARRRGAAKRGGGWERITLSEPDDLGSRQPVDLLALDDALAELARLHPRQAEIVKLKFFGGLTGDQIADVLRIDRATVVRDWTTARAWLLAQLAEAGP